MHGETNENKQNEKEIPNLINILANETGVSTEKKYKSPTWILRQESPFVGSKGKARDAFFNVRLSWQMAFPIGLHFLTVEADQGFITNATDLGNADTSPAQRSRKKTVDNGEDMLDSFPFNIS